MGFLDIWLQVGLVMLAMVTLLWLVSLVKKDASIIDPCWSLFFAVSGWVAYELVSSEHPRAQLLMVLLWVWALRLAIHLGLRARGHGEDFRYRKWREQHGSIWWWRSYFTVFLLQGILAWIICTPLVGAVLEPSAPLGLWDALGVALWLVGFLFEALGDWQLTRFRADKNNQGKVLDTGLWRYTRHPNYFGDAVLWWGFFCFAIPNAPWTIYAPVLMTLLLLRVSGVALLEKTLVHTKPAYRDYIARTSAFFPKPPKKV